MYFLLCSFSLKPWAGRQQVPVMMADWWQGCEDKSLWASGSEPPSGVFASVRGQRCKVGELQTPAWAPTPKLHVNSPRRAEEMSPHECQPEPQKRFPCEKLRRWMHNLLSFAADFCIHFRSRLCNLNNNQGLACCEVLPIKSPLIMANILLGAHCSSALC